MSRESFVFWGGFGGHNLGDEAILWANASLLRRLKPSCDQYVLTKGPVRTEAFAQYLAWGVRPIKFPSFDSLRVLWRSRLICGGGQLLDDKTLVFPIGWTSLFLLINRLFGNAPVILCIGAEPIYRTISKLLTRVFYPLASACVCRDEQSAVVLQNVGMPKSKIILSKDVVFSIDRSMIPSRIALSARPRTICVIVSHDKDRSPNQSGVMVGLIKAMLSQKYRVTLVAHDLRTEYDAGFLEQLKSKLGTVDNLIFGKARSLSEVLTVYAESDMVVSSRMHPLILASLVGSLPVAIEGSLKVAALINFLNLPAVSIRDLVDRPVTTINRCVENRDTHLADIQRLLPQYKMSVEETVRRVI